MLNKHLHRATSTPNLMAGKDQHCEIIKSRGYKPSDRRDPQKREYLINLSKRIWHMVIKLDKYSDKKINKRRLAFQK